MFLILDRLKVHRARLAQDWLAEHRAEIEVHDLPAYSPELNPDEGVNADLKQAVPRKAPARSKQQPKRAAISQPHAQPLEAAEADPLHLPPPAVPLRRLIQDHPGRVNKN